MVSKHEAGVIGITLERLDKVVLASVYRRDARTLAWAHVGIMAPTAGVLRAGLLIEIATVHWRFLRSGPRYLEAPRVLRLGS